MLERFQGSIKAENEVDAKNRILALVPGIVITRVTFVEGSRGVYLIFGHEKVSNPTWRSIDDMTWPLPDEGMNELEWRLRYGTPSHSDRLVAASILSAYRQIVSDPRRKRDYVIKRLRHG